MARVFTESFEGAHLLQWLTGNNYAVQAGGLDGSAYTGRGGGGGAYGDFQVPDATEYYVGFYFSSQDVNTNIPIQWLDGAVQGGYVTINQATKELQVVILGAGTYGSGQIIVGGYTTYHIQVHIKIDNATGVVQVKLNDVLVIDQSGIDTQPASFTAIDTFRIGQSGSITLQDSICVNDSTGSADNSWPGIVRFKAKTVVGAGFYVNNWSRNTGSTNWEAVDEIPHDSDTTYLYTTSATIYESFSMSAPQLTFANIKALRTMAVVKKDTGTVKLAVGIRDMENSADYFTAAADVGVAYGMLQDRRATDPSTSLSWTQAGVDAVQALIISSS